MNERDIFIDAVQIESLEERRRFVDKACGDDSALRERVDALLRAHSKGDSFLEGHLDAGPDTVPELAPIAEQPGSVIGPYKLLQQIGEGGMGVVYMAEQAEPVKRRVALKIIKPGMDSRQVIARFETERQALAMMDHPNIAKVLDAGTTDSGRPYFAMELVNGISLTRHCDEQHLTTRERLELFIPICHAVQHAHQKGVIHRDLKPSNVLIALYDGTPVAKVIDFGVAKAISQNLTEKTVFTELGQIVGTLEYMSPEQAQRNQLDIDTRSDIYSLGVLLYELLTGATPFERERLRTVAFDEVLRIIREEEPPRPSLRVSTSDMLPAIAANRRIEPQRLSTLVRGELDWIVMKALEKDRGRRYATANDFASDVQHYLQDEPVEACPPSLGYKLGKFARRNRIPLTMAALFVATLMTATAISVWQAVEAHNARQLADERLEREQEANSLATRRADRCLRLISAMYTETNWLRDTPGLEEVRLSYLERALELFEELERDTQYDNARFYQGTFSRRLAILHMQRGNYDEAKRHAARSVDLIAACVADRPMNVGALTLGLITQAQVDHFRSDSSSAEKSISRAIEICERRLESEPNNDEALGHLAQALSGAGLNLRETGRYDEAEEVMRRAIGILEQMLATDPDDKNTRWKLLSEQTNLALIFEHRREGDKAVELLREVIKDFEEAIREDPWFQGRQHLAQAQRKLGVVLLDLIDDPAEAEKAFREAAKTLQGLVDDYPLILINRQNLAATYNNLANTLKRLDRLAEAYSMYEKAIGLQHDLTTDFPKNSDLRYDLAMTQGNFGSSLRSNKEYERSIAVLDEAEETLRELIPAGDAKHLNLLNTILGWKASAQRDLGRLDEALQIQHRSVGVRRRLAEEQPRNMAYASSLGIGLHNLAEIHRKMGELDEVVQLLKEAISYQQLAHEAFPKHDRFRVLLKLHNAMLAWCLAYPADADQDDLARALEAAQRSVALEPTSGYAMQNLGVVQYRKGDWEASIETLSKSNELSESGGDSYQWFFLAMAHHQVGHEEEARKWYDRAVQWMDENEPEHSELSAMRAEASQLLGLAEAEGMIGNNEE